MNTNSQRIHRGSPPHTFACQRASEVHMTQVGLYILPQPKGVCARKVSALSLACAAYARLPRGQYETAEETVCVFASSGALAVPFASRARARLSLSLTHTHIQIHTHKHKHKRKRTTGARNSERSHTQSDLMLSFTCAMSLSCVPVRMLCAE